MFGGVSVSLDPDERKLVEHLRRQRTWKFTFAYGAAAGLMILVTVANVVAITWMLAVWPSTPGMAGTVAALAGMLGISTTLFIRTRWAMVAYRLIQRVDAVHQPATP